MSAISFSERVWTNDHVGYPAASKNPNVPLVLAINNQLLVAEGVESKVVQQFEQLKKNQGIHYQKVTSLLDGLAPPKNRPEDVSIYQLELGPPTPGQINTIFELTGFLRANVAAGSTITGVSPNHVLIPAPLEHGCPSGPPKPWPVDTAPPPITKPSGIHQTVTVIDSGYQWNGGSWGQDPLVAAGRLVGGTHRQSERLPWLAQPFNQAASASAGRWEAGDPDVPSWHGIASHRSPETTADGRLVALAGHANFVAGVIAQHAPSAVMIVRNHNGFNRHSNDLPTEATIARALCQAGHDGARVISLGFAFSAYDSIHPGHAGVPPISAIWKSAFEYAAAIGGTPPVVVAPAGNQATTDPRYPAALWKLGTPFENVVGVASIDRLEPTPRRSCFSNHGSWVRASAVGSNVYSTFLPVHMPLEDTGAPLPGHCPPPKGTAGTPVDFTQNGGWAYWNGTSFAAPKIAAGICNQLAVHGHPSDAIKAFLETGTDAGDRGLGWAFEL